MLWAPHLLQLMKLKLEMILLFVDNSFCFSFRKLVPFVMITISNSTERITKTLYKLFIEKISFVIGTKSKVCNQKENKQDNIT